MLWYSSLRALRKVCHSSNYFEQIFRRILAVLHYELSNSSVCAGEVDVLK